MDQLRCIDTSQAGGQVVTERGVIAGLEEVSRLILAAIRAALLAGNRVIALGYIVEDLRGVTAVVEVVKLRSCLTQPAAGALLNERQYAGEGRCRSGGAS